MDNGKIISFDLAFGRDVTVVAEIKNGDIVNTYTGGEWDAITAAIEQINTSPFPYLNEPTYNA